LYQLGQLLLRQTGFRFEELVSFNQQFNQGRTMMASFDYLTTIFGTIVDETYAFFRRILIEA